MATEKIACPFLGQSVLTTLTCDVHVIICETYTHANINHPISDFTNPYFLFSLTFGLLHPVFNTELSATVNTLVLYCNRRDRLSYFFVCDNLGHQSFSISFWAATLGSLTWYPDLKRIHVFCSTIYKNILCFSHYKNMPQFWHAAHLTKHNEPVRSWQEHFFYYNSDELVVLCIILSHRTTTITVNVESFYSFVICCVISILFIGQCHMTFSSDSNNLVLQTKYRLTIMV